MTVYNPLVPQPKKVLTPEEIEEQIKESQSSQQPTQTAQRLRA